MNELKIAGPLTKHVALQILFMSGQVRADPQVSVIVDMDSAMTEFVQEQDMEVSVLRIHNARQVFSAPKVLRHVLNSSALVVCVAVMRCA